MMDDKSKIEQLAEFINKVEMEENLKNTFIQFLRSYDGSNTNDLLEFTKYMMIEMLNLNIYKSKAEGYDILKLAYDDFKDNVEVIKEDFESLQRGEYPKRSALSSFADQDSEESEE